MGDSCQVLTEMFFSLTPFCQNLHADRRGYHPYWLSQQIQIKIWNPFEIYYTSIVKKDLRSICFYIHLPAPFQAHQLQYLRMSLMGTLTQLHQEEVE